MFTARPRRRWYRRIALTALSLVALLVATPGVGFAAPPGPWHIASSPNLDSGNNHFQEVSCWRSTHCAAVGYTQSPSTLLQRSLVATESNGVWKLGSVPARGTSNNSLWNVSCVSYTRCVAVGYSANTSIGYYQTLIATYDGRTWSLSSSPNRPNVDNFLLGVDCADATHCVAVGRSFDQTTNMSRNLALSLSGSRWTIAKTPDRAHASNLLADVSCGDATHCVAVGYTVRTSDNLFRTLAIDGTGATWKLHATFDRANASNVLRDVVCTSTTSCIAVGATDPGVGSFDEESLIETLSGGVWTLAPSPSRAGYDNHLWAVAAATLPTASRPASPRTAIRPAP